MASDFDPGQTSSLLGADYDALSDRNVAAILATHGPEKTFEALLAAVEHEAEAADKLYYAACKLLYDSDEVDTSTDSSAVRQPGTECLVWLAQRFPDLSEATSAGSEGSSFSRTGDGRTRMIGHNLLCVAVEHVRQSVASNAVEDIGELIEAIEAVSAYIDESDFPALYSSYVAEFGPIVVDIAEAENEIALDNPFASDTSYRAVLDDLLGRVADPFLDTPVELQNAARLNISTGSIEAAIANGRDYDFALTRSIETSDIKQLVLLIEAGAADMQTIGHNVWTAITELLGDGDEYGATVMDMIYQHRPGYFSRFSNLEDDSGDIFYGRTVGEAVGMAGNIEAIKDLVNPDSKQDNMMMTVAGIATGLGRMSNYDGLKLLDSRLTHWSRELRDQVKPCFRDGQKQAGHLASSE